MLYPYATFPERLIITYSDVKNDGSVHVNFEQPTDYGFKEARYTLPTQQKLFSDGYTPKEEQNLERILNNNQELIMEMAKETGEKVAESN